MNFKEKIDELQELFKGTFICWDVAVKIKNIDESELACAVFFNLWGTDILLELVYDNRKDTWIFDDDDVTFTISSSEEIWMVVAGQMQTIVVEQEAKIDRLENSIARLTKHE